MQSGRVDVLGVGISAISLDGAVDEIMRWIEHGERHYVCVTNVHTVIECQHDEELRRIHNASGLTTPDGMPIVWCLKRAGAVERHSGVRPRPDARAVEATRAVASFGLPLRHDAANAGVAVRAADVAASPVCASPAATHRRFGR